MTAETGTVRRTLLLLSCLSEQETWQLSALAQRLGLPRSTVHRLLGLARSEGYVETEGNGIYRAGPALHRLGGRLSARMPLKRIAAPMLEAFTARFGEVSLLNVLDRPALKMFFAAKAEPPTPMRYVIELNVPGTLAWGAAGRGILAFMREEEIDAVIRRAEPSPADGRRLVETELRAVLKEIRAQGYAMSQQQRTMDGVGIAVPFFAAGGEVMGNVTVTVPVFRYVPEGAPPLIAALQEMAREMSSALGA
jgi:DNA-binding IclR family transcriptional regulator